MYLLCELWNRDWEDKLILSQQAVYQLLDPKRGTGKLAEELGPQNPKQANLIFIPVVHDDHWFLIVFSREEDTFYVLDSLPSLSRISTINGIISTLKEHLQQASVGPQYSVKVLPVKRQDNNFDYGFHVLLYIKEFHNRNLICSIDKAMVEKCRMETSIDLVCHPLNESERDEDDHGDDEERGEQGHSVFNTPVDDHRLPSPTANTPVDDHWLSSPTGKGTEDLLQHVALDADKKKPVEAEDGEQNHKMLEDNTEAASGKNAEDAKKSVDAADEAEDGEQNQKMLEDNTEAASKAASAKNAEDAKKPVDAADGEQNQKMLEDNTEAAGEEMKKQKAKAAGEEHKPAGGTEAASGKSVEDASSSLKDDRKVEEANKNAAKRNKMRTQGSELEQSKTEDDRKVEADKNAAKRNKKRTQRSELKQSKTEAAGEEMNKAAKGKKKRTLDSKLKQSTPKMPPGCERKLVSPELPSGCERQIKRQTLTKDFSEKRIWLNNVVLEDVHDLVKSESKTVLRFADISMTGFELEQSLQGGEGAKKVMEFFMQCLNAEQKSGLKRIFVSPLKKVKGQDDQDLKTKIRDVVPRRKARGQRCFTTETIIYCPVFIDDEWIVVCFFFTQSKDQIHVCCRSGSYQNVRDFCSTLGESLTDGFRNCGHKVPAFGKKLAHTPTYVEPNDTALASMYFMEKFNGSDEARIMRLKCNEKEYRDAFIQDYKVGLLPYLMRHKINEATLPDIITQLTERRNKKQKA
ncbi:unnamed protein product [Miscanthus lutarioriparius]|uniref:Ubiquitin-like protease family profile domain-containing protein n=1 Tax=Miscanthus lutarioriparius TaxID=422564 RepID=A0A811NGD7_9POAL|nr:unnamed protein product [Miscanthus lutarioriparius]